MRGLLLSSVLVVISSVSVNSEVKEHGLLMSLFGRFNLKRCLILTDFPISFIKISNYVKYFSKWNIATATMGFEDFKAIALGSVAIYEGTGVVIEFTNRTQQLESLVKYSNLTRKEGLVWMVMVGPQVQLNASDLFVSYHTQFLVIEQHNNTFFNLREFYAIRSEIRTENIFGTWSKESKLSAPSTPLILRRRDMNGLYLRAMHDPARRAPVQLEVWSCLSEFYNFRTIYVLLEEILEVHRYNRTKADAALMDLAFDRNSYAKEALSPLGRYHYHIFIKKPSEDQSFWISYLRPFTVSLWIAIGIWTITYTCVIILANKKNFKNPKQNNSKWLGYGCLAVDSLVNQRGIDVRMITASAHIAYFVTQLFGSFLHSLYDGELRSYLTNQKFSYPFDSLEGFVQDETYNITAGSKYRSQWFLQDRDNPLEHIYRHRYIKFNDTATQEREVCSKKLVILEEQRFVYAQKRSCEVVHLPKPVAVVYSAIWVGGGGRFLPAFKYLLVKLYATGILDRTHKSAWIRYDQGTPQDMVAVNLPRVFPPITFLLLGVCLAICLLFAEMLRQHC